MHILCFDTGLPQSVRLAGLFGTYVVLAFWIKYIVARSPLGWARLALCLPVFLANTIWPWMFNPDEEVLNRLSTAFILTWLCNFKVLTFCAGRQPLRESMTLAQIAAVMMLPLFPQPEERSKAGPEGRLHDSAGSGLGLALRWLGKLVLLGIVVHLLVTHGDDMPRVVKHFVYAFGLYSFVGFLMDGPGALAVEALGLQLVPTFDQPWMSSSASDFWGRRWNITTSSVLRTTVYDPVIEGSFINPKRLAPPQGTPKLNGSQPPPQQQPHEQHGGGKIAKQNGTHEPAPKPLQASAARPSILRRQLALQATFFVSGIVHEYVAWLIADDMRWGWKWTVFFWMQATVMTLELLGARLLRKWGVRLPRLLSIFLTLAAMEAMAYSLFFGFVERDCNIADRVVSSVSASFQLLIRQLGPLVDQLLAAGRLTGV